MKSVGEAMAIGRTFQESLQKALRSLETGSYGLESRLDPAQDKDETRKRLATALRVPGAERIWHLADAFRAGMSQQEIHELCHIDPWFLAQIEDLVGTKRRSRNTAKKKPSADTWRAWKRKGFSDRRLAQLMGVAKSRHASGAMRPGASGIQACGFLRRRICLRHGLHVLHL